LPKEWSGDEARRTKAGVPNGIEFTTWPAIALAQIERLLSRRAPWHCVLADAGQGAETAFQGQRTARGLAYVVGVTTQVNVWPPGHAPLPPLPHSGRGNMPTRLRLGRAAHERPVSMKALAKVLPAGQGQNADWRRENV
jgi:SRSO17 transposase